MLRTTLLFGVSAVMLVAAIIYAPGEAFQASGQGLTIWWRIVFPALLPFLVLVEILLASGFAHGIGVLLEPFTRKALGLPGSFGWILPLGLTAGYPAVASAAASLYKQGKISAQEAEKMVSAAHFCSPMLIIVVIGTGFLTHPALGLFLLIIHWISGLASAISLHLLYSARSADNPSVSVTAPAASISFTNAFKEMELARKQDGRSFGKLLGDSVSNAVQTLMITGGTILIFAVVIHVIHSLFSSIVPSALIAGLLEIHLGTFAMANLKIPAAMCAAIIGGALGWSGLSAYLQIRAILAPAGIGGRHFLIHRLMHGAYAYIFTLLLWKPLAASFPGALPTLANLQSGSHSGISHTLESLLPDAWIVTSWLKSEFLLFALLLIGMFGFSFIWRNRSEC